MGKRALFWVPEDPDVPAEGWDPMLGRGPVAVECPSCGTHTRVGLLDLVMFAMPLPVWLPGRRFSTRMSCPACRKTVWASVSMRSG